MQKLIDAKISYNYCNICSREPKTNLHEPNYTPLRWWDGDDGWKIGTLCRWCWNEVMHDRPSPEDFTYEEADRIASDVNVDEDIIHVLNELSEE
jgi:hypothetical protein